MFQKTVWLLNFKFHVIFTCYKVGLIFSTFKNMKNFLKNYLSGLPWWSSGSESTLQCGGCRFDPCPGRSHMPWGSWAHAPQLLSLHLGPAGCHCWAHTPQLPKLDCPRAHAPQQEKPLQGEALPLQPESSPCFWQLEKEPTRGHWPSTAKHK